MDQSPFGSIPRLSEKGSDPLEAREGQTPFRIDSQINVGTNAEYRPTGFGKLARRFV
jgi:hypothetical protein